MRVLLIHQNFPGQFRRIAKQWAADPNIDVLGIGHRDALGLDGVKWIRYDLHRDVKVEHAHSYLVQLERSVLRGQAVARVLLQLKQKGYEPDVVLAHPGWGETLYVKNVFPRARLIHFCEWYYRSQGADMNFDAEFPDDFNAGARVETWNALHALNLVNCDAAVMPTQWQLQQHPEIFHSKIKVIHEGVDMSVLYPDAQAELTLPDGFQAKSGMPIITYVARQLEPYRGFHSFMRALPIIQKAHPDCHTIIIGGDGVSYGGKPRDAANWREKMLKEVCIDASRTHFLGQIPYDMYRKVLQVSRVHTYLTYPFVLSWSMLEAMATGCLVVGSRTSPVEEVIRDGKNGLLVDFFDPQDIAEKVVMGLREPMSELRAQARADVLARYDFAQAEPAFRALLSG